jgi:hypothetical protein
MGPQLYFVNKFILAPNHISWVTVNGIKAGEMHMVYIGMEGFEIN